MQQNLRSFERLVRLSLGIFSFFAAAVLFTHPLARLAAALFGILALWECAAGTCWLFADLGQRSPNEPMKTETRYLLGFAAIQSIMAYEWWSAGWEKITDPNFVPDMAKTLGFFASKNPFVWYKSFLLGSATDHAALFGFAVEWGELAVAIALFAAAIVILLSKRTEIRRLALLASIVALIGCLLMNANFYLAAGWTGPGTKGSNVVMFWTQAVLLYIWISLMLTRKQDAPV